MPAATALMMTTVLLLLPSHLPPAAAQTARYANNSNAEGTALAQTKAGALAGPPPVARSPLSGSPAAQPHQVTIDRRRVLLSLSFTCCRTDGFTAIARSLLAMSTVDLPE